MPRKIITLSIDTKVLDSAKIIKKNSGIPISQIFERSFLEIHGDNNATPKI